MGLSPVELSFDQGTLLLRGVAARPGWEFDPRIGCLRTHALHYGSARTELLREPDSRDRVRVPPRIAWPKVEPINLQPVTVTTYDSAYARMGEMGDRFGLAIFDEAHHLPGRRYREAALMCAAPMRLGLTATPERADGRHVDLVDLVGPTVYRQEISEVRGDTLADYDVVRIPVKLSDEEQRKYDQASRAVRSYMLLRQNERREQAGPAGRAPAYTWQEFCAESGKDPAARMAQHAFYLKKSIEDRATEKLRVLEDLFRLHAG